MSKQPKVAFRDPRWRKFVKPITWAHFERMVARHEAAHIVMQAICGFPFKYVVLNGKGGYVENAPGFENIPRISDVLISVVGYAAEFHRRSWRWHHLALDMMYSAADDWARGRPMNPRDDFSTAIFQLNGDVEKLLRYYDQVSVIITEPEVWRLVQKLSKMLLKRKRLEWNDVRPHVAPVFNSHVARRRAARAKMT